MSKQQDQKSNKVELPHKCSCPCGETKFTVERTPFVRFYCHCEICQNLYKTDYADVVVVKSKYVQLDSNDVNFKKYRLPPALDRSTCNACGKPAAGFLKGIPGLALSFISADNFHDKSALPTPLGHVFYHRKRKEVEDALPKIHGYWKSELKVSAWILPRIASA